MPLSNGLAVLHVDGLAPHRELHLSAHVKAGRQHNIQASTRFGSTSSADVDPATLVLVGASDRRHFGDPAATVIDRP